MNVSTINNLRKFHIVEPSIFLTEKYWQLMLQEIQFLVQFSSVIYVANISLNCQDNTLMPNRLSISLALMYIKFKTVYLPFRKSLLIIHFVKTVIR